MLGVCNGFQVLTETGLLPGALLSNASLKFVCHDVHLRVDNSQTLFASGYEAGQVIRVPVAHHDGNYFADEGTLDQLEQEDRVAFRYCAADGDLGPGANPNGAIRNIAGIYNETKTVLGLMPHPENAVRPDQGGTDGCGLFRRHRPGAGGLSHGTLSSPHGPRHPAPRHTGYYRRLRAGVPLWTEP